jgi:bifunctional UDP-N-acetylglucosamine pyrophosphorylase/glucosamine-1-phosphate N-acetyltransferase
MGIKTIILAAGQGTRMRSDKPKILHKIAGKPLLEHVYDACAKIPDNEITVIYGHGAEQVLQELDYLQVNWVEQAQQLGTGHAVQQANGHIRDDDCVLILYGDVPLLSFSTLERLLAKNAENTLGLLTVNLDKPFGYGRIIRDAAGKVIQIVEERDAFGQQKLINEVNTGILTANGKHLKKWLARLGNNNAQQEYYLTDVIEMAVQDGFTVETVQPDTADEVLGVNNKQQLSHLERVYQYRHALRLMDIGVTFADPARFDLRGEITALGKDIEIDINVILEGEVSLGDRVKIGPNCIVRNASIGDDVEILPNSFVEDAKIGQYCRIGPFARIRPLTELGQHVHIGNFVEIKKSTVAEYSKINHLSYIGDAAVGSAVNIGAGTITCNYDGANKFQTVIEDGAFIGSDTQLVAPVTVGKNATIGAGSTITRNAPPEQLTLSRGKQTSVAGWQRPIKQEK